MIHHAVQSPQDIADPIDLNHFLARHIGKRAGLVLNKDGVIVAASRRAAELLDRKQEQLIGALFGAWGGLLDSRDLELIHFRNGKAYPTTVRAERLKGDGPENYVTILLTEVEAPVVQSLAGAIQSAIAGINSELPGPTLTITQTKWPEAVVGPAAQEIVMGGLRFLVSMAGTATASLDLRAKLEDSEWIEILLSLCLPNPALTPPVECDYAPFDQLWKMGGQVRVETDYPVVSMWLRLPLAGHDAQSARRL